MEATVDLNMVATFVRVVESGSFTGAARALGLPKSSVSRRVSALEKTLRVRLVQRSTRSLVLTEAGRMYFERTRAALGGVHEANTAVGDMNQEVAGLIRFTAGGDNTGMLAGLFAEFLARHPKVQIEALLTSRRVDLVGEGFDLALRAGPLVDSTLVVRRLGTSDHYLFASPAYLRKHGKPRRVSDLVRHRFVLFGPPHERGQLRLTGPDGEETVKINGPLILDDMSFAADAIAAGVGIGLLPEAYYGWMWKGGRRSPHRDLVRLLPDYNLTGSEISLVSPPTAYEPTRLTLFRDFLVENLQPLVRACTAAHAEQRAQHAATATPSSRKRRTRRPSAATARPTTT
jgi:DNA-binding transcriptional LysR family regulator